MISLIKIAFNEDTPASVFEIENPNEWNGANTKDELKMARKLKKNQIRKLTSQGLTLGT